MTPPSRSSDRTAGDPERWIATVLSDDAPPRRRAEAEAALRASDAGRRMLDALATFDPPGGSDPTADEVRVARIMAAVSTLDAADLRRVADAVMDAWRDPAFRETLRRDPAGALAARGVDVPPGMALRVVGPDPGEADAPSSMRLDLPLPPTGAPSIGRDAAREALAASGFGVLYGPPIPAGHRMARAIGPMRRAFASPFVAWGALAALVALALVTARGALLGGGDLSGAATGAPDAALGAPLAAAVLVAGMLAAVALAWWLRRR